MTTTNIFHNFYCRTDKSKWICIIVCCAHWCLITWFGKVYKYLLSLYTYYSIIITNINDNNNTWSISAIITHDSYQYHYLHQFRLIKLTNDFMHLTLMEMESWGTYFNYKTHLSSLSLRKHHNTYIYMMHYIKCSCRFYCHVNYEMSFRTIQHDLLYSIIKYVYIKIYIILLTTSITVIVFIQHAFTIHKLQSLSLDFCHYIDFFISLDFIVFVLFPLSIYISISSYLLIHTCIRTYTSYDEILETPVSRSYIQYSPIHH
jgi:hypothetical protein